MDENKDEFFEISCDNPECLFIGGHFESDCFTAEWAEEYYNMMEQENGTRHADNPSTLANRWIGAC